MEEETTQKTSKSGVQKIVLFVLLALILGGGGFFGFKIMNSGDLKAKEPKVGHVVKLEEFLVNLSDQKTFLKTEIALGIAEGSEWGKTKSDGHSEGSGDDPVIRDAVIMLLTSKSPEDIASQEGKDKLKQEIIERLNEIASAKVKPQENTKENAKKADKPTDSPENDPQGKNEPKGPVLEIYFVSFATQRY